jgi:hypothetical protein
MTLRYGFLSDRLKGAQMQIREGSITPMSVRHEIRHENTLQMDRLYKSYVGLGLTPRNESGSRTISVAHFGTFEVRLIEFVDCNRQGSSDLWIELYRHDTQSSLDSCLCRDLDEMENLGENLISQAKELCQTKG